MPYPRKQFDVDKLETAAVLGIVKQSNVSRVRLVIESYDNKDNYVAIYLEYKKTNEPDDEGFWKVSKKIKLSKIEWWKFVDLIINMSKEHKDLIK